MDSIDVELVLGKWDVVHSFTTTNVPYKGERITVHGDGTSKTYLVLDREWISRSYHNLGAILTVTELTDAGVVDSVDTQG